MLAKLQELFKKISLIEHIYVNAALDLQSQFCISATQQISTHIGSYKLLGHSRPKASEWFLHYPFHTKLHPFLKYRSTVPSPKEKVSHRIKGSF